MARIFDVARRSVNLKGTVGRRGAAVLAREEGKLCAPGPLGRGAQIPARAQASTRGGVLRCLFPDHSFRRTADDWRGEMIPTTTAPKRPRPRTSLVAGALLLLGAQAGCRASLPAAPLVAQKPGAAEARPPTQVLKMEGVTFRRTKDGGLVTEFRDAASLFEEGDKLYREKRFKPALAEWDRLLELHPQTKYRLVTLYNSALALEKLGRHAESIERYRKVMQESPRSRDAIDAAFRTGECLAKLGKWREVTDLFTPLLLRDDLKPSDGFEARVRKGVAHVELREDSEAERTLLRAARYHDEAARTESVYDPVLLAQTFHYLGEIARRRMEAAPLRLPQAQIELDLNQKGHLLLAAQARYLRAIRTADAEWAPAAGHQLGLLYERFHANIMGAPVPPELTADERAVYMDELRKKVRPLIRKAVTIYQRSLSLAARLGTQSPWASKARERMTRLQQLLDAETPAAGGATKRTSAGEPTSASPPKPASPPAAKPGEPSASKPRT